MKVIIVGGGITGLVSAILAYKKGYQVSVYESTAYLGGVLKDLYFEDDWYFNNTQYINKGSIFCDMIEEVIGGKLSYFEHNYGSITHIKDQIIFHNDFAQPVLSNKVVDVSDSKHLSDSMIDRLNLYKEDSDFLINLAKRYGDITQLHVSNLVSMQLSKVFYQNDAENVRQQKRLYPLADSMLGLPRSIMFPSNKKAIAALPVDGYNKLIRQFETYFNKMGIRYYLNMPIKPRFDTLENKINFFCRNERIHFDKAVWCANPAAIIASVYNKRLSNPVVKTYCAVAQCRYIKDLKPIYIQVFSHKHSIIRFFIYNDNGKTKVSIEGFDNYVSENDVCFQVNKYLKAYFYTEIITKLFFIKQKRYTLFTREDYEMMKDFSDKAYQYDIVSGGWHLYGRDKKIDAIHKSLEKIL